MIETSTAPGSEPRTATPWARLSRSHLRTALVAGIGAAAGAAYAHFIGCKTGTCPITSSVWTASLYGGAVGALVGWPARAQERRDHSP